MVNNVIAARASGFFFSRRFCHHVHPTQCYLQGILLETGPAYRYIRYSEADSDMGSSSWIRYDMDSEDENMLPNVLELTFEQIVDRLEKAARVQQNDVLSADAAMELCEGLASLDVVGRVYAHWSKKRRIKGMSLIRYFQVAPWERYQEQQERWNEELQQKPPSDIKQQPISQFKKPPPYAFCLRPR